MHLPLKFVENIFVMEESVSKKAVQSPYNVEEVLCCVGGDGHPRREVASMDDRSGTVKRVDHVVDG